MIALLTILILVFAELADARPEYKVVLFVTILAVAYVRWVYRRPSARIEAKRRAMRRAFRRSLIKREW